MSSFEIYIFSLLGNLILFLGIIIYGIPKENKSIIHARPGVYWAFSVGMGVFGWIFSIIYEVTRLLIFHFTPKFTVYINKNGTPYVDYYLKHQDCNKSSYMIHLSLFNQTIDFKKTTTVKPDPDRWCKCDIKGNVRLRNILRYINKNKETGRLGFEYFIRYYLTKDDINKILGR